MIISRRRRFIFVHVPKTGGTALALALEARAAADDILIGDTPKARNRRRLIAGARTAGRVWKHSRLRDVEGLVTGQEIADWFVFTIVRNPWERMASYYHWLQTQGFDHPAVQLAKSCSFAAFVADPVTEAGFRANPYGAYVSDGGGRERCAMWLRHERLDEDARLLGERLGLRLPALSRVNASPRPADWRGLYDDSTAARIADYCAEDIARFGYRFEAPGTVD